MNERDKVKTKIIALLAKTEDAGASEYEAIAAADKAAELMAHYDIEATELDFKSRSCVKKTAPFQKYRNIVIGDGFAVAIGRLCDCKTWRSSDGRQIFFGFEQDAEVAEYLYNTITSAVINEIEAYKESDAYYIAKEDGYHGTTLVTSFIHGICSRAYDRITKMALKKKAAVSKGNNALVPIKAEQIKSEFDDLGMRLVRNRTTRTVRSGRSYMAGQTAGDGINISRGVSGGSDKKAIC